jgi:hypothetical protein
MTEHLYQLEQRVKLNMSGETGVVVGRAEYVNQGNQYHVRYVASDGRQVEDWFAEDALANDGE